MDLDEVANLCKMLQEIRNWRRNRHLLDLEKDKAIQEQLETERPKRKKSLMRNAVDHLMKARKTTWQRRNRESLNNLEEQALKKDF